MSDKSNPRGTLQRHGWVPPTAASVAGQVPALRDPALAAALAQSIATGDRALFRAVGALSGLPGPRPNLSLARAIAHDVAIAGRRGDAFLRLLFSFDADSAPAGSVGEFFPLVGAFTLAARHRAGVDPRGALEGLHEIAGDVRWLVRHAVALALRDVVHGRERELPGLLAPFMDGYLYAAVALEALSERATLAAIDEPSAVLERFGEAFSMVEDAPRAHARTQGLRTLVQALAVGQANLLTRFPRETTPWLAERAATKLPELREAIAETLGRLRDAGLVQASAADVSRALAASAPVRRDADRVVEGTRGRGKRAGRSGRQR